MNNPFARIKVISCIKSETDNAIVTYLLHHLTSNHCFTNLTYKDISVHVSSSIDNITNLLKRMKQFNLVKTTTNRIYVSPDLLTKIKTPEQYKSMEHEYELA